MDIVLVKPEIPQNTGSIARTCAATETPLIIIGPTPFEISDRNARRAGLDYWPYVKLIRYGTWEEYIQERKPNTPWFFTKRGVKLYYTANVNENDCLVFGSETKGLDIELLEKYPEEQRLAIPMPCPEVRSLNLSNAVSIALYEARRQLHLDEADFRPRR